MTSLSRGAPERSSTVPLASRTQVAPGGRASGGSLHGATASSETPASLAAPTAPALSPFAFAPALAPHAVDANAQTAMLKRDRERFIAVPEDGPGMTRCHVDLAPFPSVARSISGPARPSM